MRLTGKLTLTLVTLSVATAAVSVFVIYQHASDVQASMALEKLHTLRHVRAYSIREYFERHRTLTRSLCRNLSVKDATQQFVKGFDELQSPDQGSFNPEQVQDHPGSDCQHNPDTVANATQGPPIPQKNASRYLKKHYQVEHSDSAETRHERSKRDDGTTYAKAHSRYHDWFEGYSSEMGYVDLAIVHPASGDIIYTVRKNSDLGVNLAGSALKNSKLAIAVAEIRTRKEPDVVEFVDFEPYAASGCKPALFVVTKVERDQDLLGIIVLQISQDEVSRVLGVGSENEMAELGNTGEIFLLGTDNLVRSENRFFRRDNSGFLARLRQAGHHASMLKRIERSGTATNALSRHPEDTQSMFDRREGSFSSKGLYSQEVIGSFERLDIRGLPWALVAVMDSEEAAARLTDLRQGAVGSLIFAFLLSCLGAMIAARELLRPLVQSSRAVQNIDVKNGIFDVYLPIESQDEVGELAHAINGLVSEVNSNSNQQKVMIDKAYRLLEHMMPPVVLARFRRHENMCSSTSIGTDVTLAFIEIMDLDRLFDHVNPDVAIDRYDELIASFDDVVDRHGMEKLGQCGSGIMVASGLINPKLDHTSGVLSFAQELQWVVDTFNAQHLTSVFLNVGVHKGYVSNDKAGRLHFVNELWKRTIELAKEIDSTVHKSGVRVSTAAYENVEVNSEFEFVEDDIVIGEPAWTLLGFSGKQGMLN